METAIDPHHRPPRTGPAYCGRHACARVVSDTRLLDTPAVARLADAQRTAARRVPPARARRCRRPPLVEAQLPRRLHLVRLRAPHARAVADLCAPGARTRPARGALRARAAARSHLTAAGTDRLLGERHGCRCRARPASASALDHQRHLLRRGAARRGRPEVRRPAPRALHGGAAAARPRTCRTLGELRGAYGGAAAVRELAASRSAGQSGGRRAHQHQLQLQLVLAAVRPRRQARRASTPCSRTRCRK